MNLNYKEFVIILYTPEILEYILSKDSLLSMMERCEEATGLVFI